MASILMDAYRELIAEKKALLEAEDDAAEATPGPEEGNEAGGGDDDFSIDASLDDGTYDNADGGEVTDNGGEEPSTEDSDSGSNGGGSSDGDDEVNDDNTDIFSSLTAEEQQIKIKELKSLYQNLYSSCDEILDRINNLDTDEENLHIVTRISNSMYDLKRYIADYITHVFPNKSFIENDIAFNRFLLIIKSITDILDKYQIKMSKEDEK